MDFLKLYNCFNLRTRNTRALFVQHSYINEGSCRLRVTKDTVVGIERFNITTLYDRRKRYGYYLGCVWGDTISTISVSIFIPR